MLGELNPKGPKGPSRREFGRVLTAQVTWAHNRAEGIWKSEAPAPAQDRANALPPGVQPPQAPPLLEDASADKIEEFVGREGAPSLEAKIKDIVMTVLSRAKAKTDREFKNTCSLCHKTFLGAITRAKLHLLEKCPSRATQLINAKKDITELQRKLSALDDAEKLEARGEETARVLRLEDEGKTLEAGALKRKLASGAFSPQGSILKYANKRDHRSDGPSTMVRSFPETLPQLLD